MRKAHELGAEYAKTWWGCAQSTFCATIGALRFEGILETLDRSAEERERIKAELTSERFAHKFWT